jgi:predicted methyltransferase
MTNLYRRLTNKGYTNTQIDELLWRMSHRLAINYTDQEEIVEYFNEYVNWNMQQESTKMELELFRKI